MRILQHLRARVNNDHTYPVARHFKEVHNNNLQHLTYFVIDNVPTSRRGCNCEKLLRQLESQYILELNSKTPGGLYIAAIISDCGSPLHCMICFPSKCFSSLTLYILSMFLYIAVSFSFIRSPAYLSNPCRFWTLQLVM